MVNSVDKPNHLSLSPSYVTQKKPGRKKWPCEILGVRCMSHLEEFVGPFFSCGFLSRHTQDRLIKRETTHSLPRPLRSIDFDAIIETN